MDGGGLQIRTTNPNQNQQPKVGQGDAGEARGDGIAGGGRPESIRTRAERPWEALSRAAV